MKAFFTFVTRIAMRFRYITILLAFATIALGAYAATQLQQELIPPIEFPQTFILAQASGMDSEQVLNVVTSRIEAQISEEVPEIVNIESTTNGGFGAFITAANDFGLNSDRIRNSIEQAVNNVWFPLRRIEAPDGQGNAEFAEEMLGSLTPEVLIYIATQDPSFLFQLSPQVWEQLSDETVTTVANYLAEEVTTSIGKTPLERLVEQEVVPQLRALDIVASVDIGGGQTLPDDGGESASTQEDVVPESLLLQLSPEIWDIIASKAGGLGELNASAVTTLRETPVEIPVDAPALPESWQFDGFENALDILEMGNNSADIFNDFVTSGKIVGPIGQTDDLTPEIITQMLAIDPTMVEHFDAQHLVAMSPEVFAILPDEFINSLDGFTRDQLAASALAVSITGEEIAVDPVDLPSAWIIAPPGIITFSFADIPLASFGVFTIGEIPDDIGDVTDELVEESAEATDTTETAPAQDIPEGPSLPGIFAILGTQFGAELDTADDFIALQNIEPVDGQPALTAADTLNFIVLLANNPDALGDSAEVPNIPLNPNLIIGGLSADAVAFIAEYDENFMPNLSADVFNYFSDDVLALEGVSPPLADVWSTLSNRPQFNDEPLQRAGDLLVIGNGEASQVLDIINETVPERFAGYEVRLFDSLTPSVVNYFLLNEEDFYQNLDADVLLKLSPMVLAELPDEVLAELDAETIATIEGIVAGDLPSAFQSLAELYASDVPPPDPNAPALNPEWRTIANFNGITLDNAYDLFRFVDVVETPAIFINNLFNSPGGANFAPALLGGLSQEAFDFIATEDPNFEGELSPQALQLLPETIFASLSETTQERALAGGETFKPTDLVTRSNGATSLLVTVYKTSDANTVSAFHEVEEIVAEINASAENIEVDVIFEQASFITTSIEGVVREGTLGAVFAIIIILIFLSGGAWKTSARRIVGIVLIVVFVAALIGLVALGLDAAGNDWGTAFNQADVVLRVLFIIGIVAGLLVFIYPSDLPYPAWRSTVVIGVSIPLSILMSFAIMWTIPPFVNDLLAPSAESSGFVRFLIQLFPAQLTINIMTLSGLTVAIGRVVDDSIVVLENIFRQLQQEVDSGSNLSKFDIIVEATRDVSVAIFSATGIAVVVFLPLGLTGGIIGEFFLPFGLAVTYALMGSFLVSITVVPVLAYWMIDITHMQEEHESFMERAYMPILRWALSKIRVINPMQPFRALLIVLSLPNPFQWLIRQLILALKFLPRKWSEWTPSTISLNFIQRVDRDTFTIDKRHIVLFLAVLSFVFGIFLFSQRPATFLPSFGEPQIMVAISLPPSTSIEESNELAVEFERFVRDTIPEDQLIALRTVLGGTASGQESLLGGTGISENIGEIAIGIQSPEFLEEIMPEIEAGAKRIYNGDDPDVENVSVSAGSLSDGGFGGFEMVVSGPDQDVLAELDPIIIAALNAIEGIDNVESNLVDTGGGEDAPTTFVRINEEPALSYTGELSTQDTIGIVAVAVDTIKALPEIPDDVKVSQGFDSELQAEGFASMGIAMGLAMIIIVIILIVTFNSLVYWLALILSVLVAPVGAAIALTVMDTALGISAMIGLLMLIGLVITNAIVFLDHVQSNRHERGMDLYDALTEAGGRRLRPILMTALATIIALIPLAIGLSDGAIIAEELGIVVIGGMFSSTLLTLIVVPVMYSLLAPAHRWLARLVGRGQSTVTNGTEKHK